MQKAVILTTSSAGLSDDGRPWPSNLPSRRPPWDWVGSGIGN
jgi:hypothetical protein